MFIAVFRTLLALAMSLALAAPAHGALTVRYTDGTAAPALQAWTDASHAPLAGGTVTVHRAGCFTGSGASCTHRPGDQIWLREEPAALRLAFSHELGHRFDYRVMTPRARSVFKRLVDDQRPWRSAPNSPHEKFAEAYGVCFRHRHTTGVSTGYAYRTNPKRHDRVCRLIRQTAAGVFG